MIVEELIAALGVEVDANIAAKFSKAFDSFGKGALAIVGGIGAAFVGVSAAVAKAAEAGDAVANTAERLGLSTDAVQELAYAAKLSDTSIESVTLGLGNLGRVADAATKGSKEAAGAFAQLGVHVKGAGGKIKSADELFTEISGKIALMPNGLEKSALAMQLFGKAGRDLIPLLNNGTEGLAALRQEAQDTGYVMSQETTDASKRFGDAVDRVQLQLIGFRNKLAAPLIERFARALENIGRRGAGVGKVLNAIGSGIGYIIDGFNYILEHELALRAAIWAVTTALGTWALTALSAAAASGALSLASISAAVSAAAAWLAATLPFVIMAGLIALLIDDLHAFATGGKSAIGEVIKWLNSVQVDDSPIIKLLKLAGSLLFDLSDPAKWRKLWDGITSGVPEWLKTALVGPGISTLFKLGEAGANAANGNGFAPTGGWFSAPAPANIGGSNSTTTNSKTITLAPSVVVQAQSNASPEEIARVAREAVGAELRGAAAQTGGFSK